MQKSVRRVAIRVISAAALGTALFSQGAPAAQRTFVASYGNDAANLTGGCTLVLPCRSFGAAITKTGASGEVIVLDSAGYGPVTITQSVSIISPPGVYAGVTVTTGIGVNIATNNVQVVLRGLTINGQGSGTDGILVNGTGILLSVENCTVANMGLNGIDAYTPSGRVLIRDSTIRGNVNSGVTINASVANIENSRIEANNGYGVHAVSGAWVSVSRSVVTGNLYGLVASSTQASSAVTQLSIDSVDVAENGVVGALAEANGAGNEARIGVTRSTIVRNLEGIRGFAVNASAVYVSASANHVEGNSQSGMILVCDGAGRGYFNAAGNMVIRNVYGIVLFGTGLPADCVFRTIGTNMVRDNLGLNLDGAITQTPGD